MTKEAQAEANGTLGGDQAADLKLRLLPLLTHGLAHDLNNLLTVIGGFTEVALGMASDHPMLSGHLDCVKQAWLQATVLNGRLLAYSSGFSGPVRVWRVGDLAEAMRKPLAHLLGERVSCSIEVTDRSHEVRASEAELHCLIFGTASRVLDCLDRMDRFEVHLRPRPNEGQGLFVRLRILGKTGPGGDRAAVVSDCGALARAFAYALSQDITDQAGVAFDFRLDGPER